MAHVHKLRYQHFNLVRPGFAPADIAGALRKFVDEGVSSIQIHLDRTTPETIERLSPVIEAFDAD